MEGGVVRDWSTVGVFFDADIQVDAILSYPWLRQQYLGVFPHLEALAKLELSIVKP